MSIVEQQQNNSEPPDDLDEPLNRDEISSQSQKVFSPSPIEEFMMARYWVAAVSVEFYSKRFAFVCSLALYMAMNKGRVEVSFRWQQRGNSWEREPESWLQANCLCSEKLSFRLFNFGMRKLSKLIFRTMRESWGEQMDVRARRGKFHASKLVSFTSLCNINFQECLFGNFENDAGGEKMLCCTTWHLDKDRFLLDGREKLQRHDVWANIS